MELDSELTDGGTFFVKEIDTNVLYLSRTNGGDKLTLTDGPSENHSLTGEQLGWGTLHSVLVVVVMVVEENVI